MDKNAVIGCGKKKTKDDQLELILTTHLYKDFAPLLDDVGLVFQVVFGGLTDVYLHALLRQNRTQKTDAKAKYKKKKNASSVSAAASLNHEQGCENIYLTGLFKTRVHSRFFFLSGSVGEYNKPATSFLIFLSSEHISHKTY